MSSELDQAVASQVGATPPDEVRELVLDACKTTQVTGLEKFVNLTTLTLNGCGLTTVEGFPTLPRLKVLELSDNQLSDGLDALQDAALLNLCRLSLAGNRFCTLDALEPLGSLPVLRDLDLFNCPVTEVENYREGIFDMLPSLKYLDGFDVDDNEKDEDEEDEADDDLLSSEVGDDEDDELGEDDGESLSAQEQFDEEDDDSADDLSDGCDKDEEESDEDEAHEEGGEDGEEEYADMQRPKRQRR